MDNPDNQNCPINQMQNPVFSSPFKESPYKISQQNKDYKFYYQTSPFPTNILNCTPSKKIDFTNGYCASLGETPFPSNVNIAFSPVTNNFRGDASYQRSQYQLKGQGFNDYSPFKPLITTPLNNQRISEKK